MKNRKRLDPKGNQGFSLFTVIVSLAFIGIFAMLAVYLSMANLRMKVTDMKNKDNFYTAEQALEEIRVGLQEDVGNAMSQAYTYVLENYSRIATDDASMDEIRQGVFREHYVKELTNLLKGENDTSYSLSYLTGYIDHGRELLSGNSDRLLSVVTPKGKRPSMEADFKRGVLLKNLKVIYVDQKGIASIIETDIRLGIPGVQFPTPSTLPDLMNMIIVANGGIICEGGNNATASIENPTEIHGSVYAGLLKKEKEDSEAPLSMEIQPNAHVEVSEGERLVCQGEIQVGEQAGFFTDPTVALWANGLSLASATVDLEGKTYFSDDLTVEKGTKSLVRLAGEYYGYGTPEAANASKNKELYEEWNASDTDKSSAITINGKNTTMDLSGLQKLLISGKNYIGTSSLSKDASSQDKNGDIMMGESLTVKGTQMAYLAPSELLYDGKQNNPMTMDAFLEMEEKKTPVVSKETFEKPQEIWNGTSMAQLGLNGTTPVKPVFYNDNAGKGSVYFYLNFDPDHPENEKEQAESSKAASAYMEKYFQNTTMKERMDGYLDFYLKGGGITLNDSNTYLRYITNGNMLSYKGQSDSGQGEKGKLNPATNTDMDLFLKEQTAYQDMWYTLNRKMISSYQLLNHKVMDPNGEEKDEEGNSCHDEMDRKRSVYDNLVNEAEMLSFVENNTSSPVEGYSNSYFFQASEADEALTAIMMHNSGKALTYRVKAKDSITSDGKPIYIEKTFTSEKKSLSINQELAENLRLVVCTGDVVLEEGVTFSGIIMTNGSIILKSGAKLHSAPLEAAKVFQAQITSSGTQETTVSPKDFFWEGDKYVLGNSLTTENGTQTGYLSDVYNVSDFVNYENWQKK